MSAPRVSLDRARLDRLRQGAVVVRSEPAAFSVSGMGALQCLQGLLTNDLVKPGDHSLVYGALLTPKGMIVVDFWVLRQPNGFLLLAERDGREAALDLFQRQLPPRLARMEDRTGQWSALWLFGENALGTLRFSRIGPVPEAEGRLADGGSPDSDLLIARPHAKAPFQAMVTGAAAEIDKALAALTRAGATVGDDRDAAAARILAGWPMLGAEIGEKTLPQEVRFDEIEGVSYTKGCYTGQETVARLHFRGHTNRGLRGLIWQEGELPPGTVVTTDDGKEVGTVRSTLFLPDRSVALALLRREVEPGSFVTASGRPAIVVALPFDVDLLLA